ncbi:MAG: competence/damage-inducible protein A [Chloroflexi bacterium]|nr:competence/damage-inducible protein A [Chloroflexota bacterium]MBL7061452.1 competence/damage-inducible protein A [Dehalococcoidia bacterium]
MKTEIISIGTELLLGEITNTNSAYLASQLPLLGLDLNFISTVGDNQYRLIETLKQAWQRSDIIITTGGLGPTQDDITREAVAELLGEEPMIDSTLVQKFEELFKYYKIEMPPSNIKQATVIPSAKIIQNPQGTAPGWWIERDNRVLITMPGPPREMQLMWTKEILPRLQQKVASSVIVSKTLKIFGLTEAEVDERASPFLSATNPTLATYAKTDGIYLRITAKTDSEDKAKELIAKREADIRAIFNDYIWGMDSDSLESIVGTLLTAKGLSLATMESYTGGLLASVITNVPGSSKYFRGGLVAYTDEARTAFGFDPQLISRYGTVSTEVVEAMATISREKLGTSIGVGLTGVMGPTETEGKPVGTIFVGLNDGQRRQSFAKNYPGNRLQVKQRAVTSALFELRRILL